MKWWHMPLLMVNFVLWFFLATFAFSYYVRVDYALLNFWTSPHQFDNLTWSHTRNFRRQNCHSVYGSAAPLCWRNLFKVVSSI